MEVIGQVWDLIILSPMINVLVVLSHYLFSSLGLTIIVLTIIIKAVTYPLTIKQLRATKAMQTIQSQVAELQKKYAKDRQKLAQEQLKLYKQTGMNPAGCLVPILVQMPIWIALYQAVIRVLAVAPEDFLNLSRHLYSSWPLVFSEVPLGSSFLWLDLAVPDQWLFLPILVGGTMWAQQKMVTPSVTDPKQQAQSRMMLWMMPLMFAFLTLSVPSGLALYWAVSNILGIVTQYFFTGWGGLIPSRAATKVTGDKKNKGRVSRQELSSKGTAIAEKSSAREEGLGHGKSGSKGEDRGGGYPARPNATGREPGGGGDRRRKRR